MAVVRRGRAHGNRSAVRYGRRRDRANLSDQPNAERYKQNERAPMGPTDDHGQLT